MPVQTHVSLPFIGLTLKALCESAFKSLKMEIDKKNMNREILNDMLMLGLLFVAPILLALLC